MQNDFEKQVRDKMKELDLVPSAPVWERVQEQIRQKKDRKRAIIWLPLLGLLLAGGIWWLNDAGNNQIISTSHHTQTNLPSTQKVHSENNIRSKQESENNSPIEQNAATLQNHVERVDQTNTSISILPGSGKGSPEIRTSGISSAKIAKRNKINTIIKEPVQLKETKPAENLDHTIRGIVPFSEQQKLSDNHLTGQENAQLSTIRYQPDKMIQVPNEMEKNNPVRLSEQQTQEIQFKPIVKNLSSGPIVNIARGNDRTWKFGFSGSAGISGAKYGANLFAGNKIADAVRIVDSVQPPFIYNNAASKESKTIQNNFAFSAGMIARKSLSNRFVFSAGILYEYLSYNSNVGIRINQPVAVQGTTNGALYYTSYSTKQQEYLNQYHFISIPVTIHYQVLRNAPLSINAGLSVKQLVKTNALEFNHTSQMYFYNRNAFNRTQLFPAIGIEYALLKDKSLIVGPQFESSIVAFEKNGSDEHLYVGSLKVQWLFLKN
jgi:hypothetical protein